VAGPVEERHGAVLQEWKRKDRLVKPRNGRLGQDGPAQSDEARQCRRGGGGEQKNGPVGQCRRGRFRIDTNWTAGNGEARQARTGQVGWGKLMWGRAGSA
jgi:hypothetical protein